MVSLSGKTTLIPINYSALRRREASSIDIPDDLLRKAKKRLGFAARRKLLALLDSDLRLMAMEVAQRQVNPRTLYDSEAEGIFTALRAYDVGKSEQSFQSFAMPFVKHAMQSARSAS